jgi:hypothetical protein
MFDLVFLCRFKWLGTNNVTISEGRLLSNNRKLSLEIHQLPQLIQENSIALGLNHL